MGAAFRFDGTPRRGDPCGRPLPSPGGEAMDGPSRMTDPTSLVLHRTKRFVILSGGRSPESKNLRIWFTFAVKSVRRSFDLLALAQDDILFYTVPNPAGAGGDWRVESEE